MLIEIQKDIFEDSEFEELGFLLRILSYKGRYNFFVDINIVSGISNFDRLNELDKANIEAEFNKTILESSTPDLIVTKGENLNEYNLEEAIFFLNQPITIVVENSLNDGHFVRTIIKHFDKTGLLVKHFENHWLKLGNAGGKNNFINFLSSELKSYRRFSKANHRYLRAFVIADSDKKFPIINNGEKQQKLVNFLQENKIPFHILEKREMENYLPDETINSIPDHREFIDAYLKLSPIQKDFFDLEKGFRDKRFSNLYENIQHHYKSVGEEDYKIFRKQGLANKYKEAGQNFKAEFPKLFHHSSVTKESLLKRCEHHSNSSLESPYNPNELPELVEKIAKLL